jgi:hypothetical protein
MKQHFDCVEEAKEAVDDLYYVNTKGDTRIGLIAHQQLFQPINIYNLLRGNGPLYSSRYGKANIGHYNRAVVHKSGSSYAMLTKQCDALNTQFKEEHTMYILDKRELARVMHDFIYRVDLRTREFSYAVVELYRGDITETSKVGWHLLDDGLMYIHGCYLTRKMAETHKYMLENPYKLFDIELFTKFFPHNVSSDLFHIVQFYNDISSARNKVEIVETFDSLEKTELACHQHQEMECSRAINYAIHTFFGEYLIQTLEQFVCDACIFFFAFQVETMERNTYTKLFALLEKHYTKYKESNHTWLSFAAKYSWLKHTIIMPFLRDLIITFSLCEFTSDHTFHMDPEIALNFQLSHFQLIENIENDIDTTMEVDISSDFQTVDGIPYPQPISPVSMEEARRRATRYKKLATLITQSNDMMEDVYATIFLKNGNLPDHWDFTSSAGTFCFGPRAILDKDYSFF